VVDGPLTDTQTKYYDVKYKPHCLSRGFREDEGNLGHMNGDAISPQSIEEVLQIGDYERLVAEMESRVHDAIPFGIGGDFETFTVPYSKEFILILRLWSQILMHIWQTLYSTSITHSSTGYGTCGSSEILKQGLWRVAGIISGTIWSWRGCHTRSRCKGGHRRLRSKKL
jgi:hypothetical protein